MSTSASNLTLNALQRRFLDAVFDTDQIPDALQDFADFCGADIGHLMVADGKRTLLESTFSIELDPRLIELEPQMQDINPRVLAIPKMKPGAATRDADFITPEEIARDTAYQEMILPCGLGHFSGVPIVNSSALTMGVALHRPYSGEAFNDTEARLHEIAAAVCAPVFELADLVGSSRARSVLEMCDETVAAVAIKSDHTVLDQNESFSRLLETGTLRIDQQNRLRFPIATEQDAFSRMINRRVRVTTGRFIVSEAAGRPGYVASAYPIPQPGLATDLIGATLLVLKPIRAERRLNSALVREAFGLTPAEFETAQLLFEGKSVSEISQVRGVSSHTTQTQMKRILSKMECSRQAEAVTLLMAFSTP